MVCVLSRLANRQPSWIHPIRYLARSTGRKTISNNAGPSPLKQTAKQVLFCFGIIIPGVYYTATTEAINMTGNDLSIDIFPHPAVITWDIWDKIKPWVGMGNHVGNPFYTRILQFLLFNCTVFGMLPLLLRNRGHLFIPYFTSSSTSSAISPLTSMFVHENLLHLISNMLGLFVLTVGWYGRNPPCKGSLNEMSYSHITCFLLSSGMCAALACSVRGLITKSVSPGFGFSSAIYALLFYEFFTKPESRVGIVFTNVNVSAEEMAYFVVGFEALLLLFSRYHRMGNFAHLAGAAFGYWYAVKGSKLWKEFRDLQVQLLNKDEK